MHLGISGLSCLSVTAGGGKLSCNFASDRLTLLYYLLGDIHQARSSIVLYRTLLYYLAVATVCVTTDKDQARCIVLYRTRYIWPLVPFLPSRLEDETVVTRYHLCSSASVLDDNAYI